MTTAASIAPVVFLKPETFDAPAAWASYLVNDDASGMEPDEIEDANVFLACEGVKHVSIVGTEGDEFTGRFEGLTTTLTTYTYLVHVPA